MKQNILLLIVLATVTVLQLFAIGNFDLEEWDESRNGVNAYEMIQKGDLVNYYYNNQLDTWNAKPPLMIWSIALSYKLFGYNEFALRFPSFLFTLVFFIFCFKIVQKLADTQKAFFCCLLLLSCKAILGMHVGLTGDFDSLLIALLTASVYYFILYFEFNKHYAIYLVGLLTGLAFYTKGTASVVFIPSMFAYLLLRSKVIAAIKDKRVWLAAFIFVLIAASWFILVIQFGKTFSESIYGSKNSVETMLVYDTFNRLTSSNFETVCNHDSTLFFQVTETRLNLWNYLFWVGILIGLIALIKNRKNLFSYVRETNNKVSLLSFCMLIPLSIAISAASNQHTWYLAPIFMFVAIITVEGICFLQNKWRYTFIPIVVLFVFTFVRQVIYVYTLPNEIHHTLSENTNLYNKKIIVTNDLHQDILLYLEWLNAKIERVAYSDLGKYTGEFVLINKADLNDSLKNQLTDLSSFDNYCLAKIK